MRHPGFEKNWKSNNKETEQKFQYGQTQPVRLLLKIEYDYDGGNHKMNVRRYYIYPSKETSAESDLYWKTLSEIT
jgi:hypothetical protein